MVSAIHTINRLTKLIKADLEERTLMVSDALKKPRDVDTLTGIIGVYASPSQEISTETHPKLMADIMEALLDTLQKGRVQDLTLASILRNLHSVKLTAFAPRMSVSMYSQSLDLDVIEPVFAVSTLTEEDNGIPQHAFTFTLSSQYGFRFHNLMTETAKKSKAQVQDTLAEVLNNINNQNTQQQKPTLAKAAGRKKKAKCDTSTNAQGKKVHRLHA